MFLNRLIIFEWIRLTNKINITNTIKYMRDWINCLIKEYFIGL